VLFLYAVTFFAIPGGRGLWAHFWENPRILKRNSQRKERAAELVKHNVPECSLNVP
jgi:hypothetical protein